MLYKRAMRSRLREGIAGSAHNQLAGNLLKQGRVDAGQGKPLKQEAYARQLAAKMQLETIARQTLSAWERGTTVVPAAALLASAEVLGVDVGQLVQATRATVRERIANLEALVSTADESFGANNDHSSKRPTLPGGSA